MPVVVVTGARYLMPSALRYGRAVSAWRLCWLALSEACAPARTLDQVPIIDADAEEQALIRAELDRFDAAVGPGRVMLRSVRVEPLGGVHGPGVVVAKYLHDWRTVKVDPDAPTEHLTAYIRHELCHALDLQEGQLSAERTEALLALQSLQPDLASFGYNRDDEIRRELFAYVCELGPDFALFGQSFCGSDSPEVSAVATWLTDVVWRHSTPLADVLTLPDPASFGLGCMEGVEPAKTLSIDEFEIADVGALQFRVVGASDACESALLNPFTGEEAFTFEDEGLSLSEVEQDSSSTSFGTPILTSQDLEGGGEAGVVEFGLGAFGKGYRLLARPDSWHEWGLISECPSASAWDVTALHGTVWWAWAADTSLVHWRGASP